MGYTTVKLPCNLGAEVWYVNEVLNEILPCTVKAIRADWSLESGNTEKPSITVILAAARPSQLTIHTNVNDIGKSVFFNEHAAYDALAKMQR